MRTRTRQIVHTPFGPALKQNSARHQTACLHKNNPHDGGCGGCYAVMVRLLETLTGMTLPQEARSVVTEAEALLAGKTTERRTS